jgi:outer membrane receptor protein involved in Fe transport
MHTGNYFVSPDKGKGQIAPSSSKNTMQNRVDVLSGSPGWTSNQERWDARVWVKNLTDVEYWSEADVQSLLFNTAPHHRAHAAGGMVLAEPRGGAS